MSQMNREQMEAMVADLEEGEPLFVVQAAWDDISMWLIENRPVKEILNEGTEDEFVVQEPWEWEADSDTIVLFGHPVYASGWQSAPSKEERENFVDESMVLGPSAGAQAFYPDEPDASVRVTF